MRKKEQAKEWLVYMLIGFVSGTVAFCMITAEEWLLKAQVIVIRYFLRGDCTALVANTSLGVGGLKTFYADCDNNTSVIPFDKTI